MARVVAKYIAGKSIEAKSGTHAETGVSSIKPKTIFHSIDRSNLPPHEKTPLRLQQEGLTVLFAGGETGSRLLAHTVYHLLDNPEVLCKVKTEVLDAAKDSNKIPDVKVLEGLPWLVRSVFGVPLPLKAYCVGRMLLYASPSV